MWHFATLLIRAERVLCAYELFTNPKPTAIAGAFEKVAANSLLGIRHALTTRFEWIAMDEVLNEVDDPESSELLSEIGCIQIVEDKEPGWTFHKR
jgi:hypothetical protein